jgi:imidazolonepropionase-like amidohydrolase
LNRPRIETGKQADTHVVDGDPLKDVRNLEGVGAMGLVMEGGVSEVDRSS